MALRWFASVLQALASSFLHQSEEPLRYGLPDPIAEIAASRTCLNTSQTVTAVLSPPHTLQPPKLSVLFTASALQNATTARHLLHRGRPRRADDATTNLPASRK